MPEHSDLGAHGKYGKPMGRDVRPTGFTASPGWLNIVPGVLMKLALVVRARYRVIAKAIALIAIGAVVILTMQLFAGLVRAFWAEPFEMKTAAMAPAIAQGDRVFVDKRAYRSVEPAVGDIVVVQDQDRISYVRRIVARRDDLFTTRSEIASDPPLTFPRSAIIGKVSTVYWSAERRSLQWEAPR